MHITPNNKLSNHYRKKKTERTVWIEDQTVSGSFRQNLETMREKTKTGMFYEDYLNPNVSFSNNICPPDIDNFFSMPNNDFNDSMMNPYNSSNAGVVGVEGIDNVFGGDNWGLGNNKDSSVFVWENNENGNNGIINYMVDVKDANDDYNFGFYNLTDAYGNVIKGEKSHNCYPLSPDTDRDGMPDGEEVRNGLNPNPEHSLKIPTLLMLPENGGAIYSSMLEQVDLYIFIMTVSGAIPDCPEDKYGSDLLVQGVQEVIVPYNVIYQLKSINSADPNTIPFVPVDANCYQTSVDVMINGTNHKTNLTVFTFTLTGSSASDLLSALLDYSQASRITHELSDHVPEAVAEITPCIVENPDKKGSWWDSACSIGETIVNGVKSGAKVVVNAAISTGKAIINTVQDSLNYLAEVGQSILDAYVAVWNQLIEWGSQIVNAIANAVNWFVNWIIEMVTVVITAVLDPVISAMDSYVQSVSDALMKAYDEYSSTGSVSYATLKQVNDAFMGPLYWALVAVSVAVVVALTIAMPFTATFGTLIGMLVSVIVVVVMMNMFSSSTTEGEDVTGLSLDMTMQQIVDFAKNFAESQESGTRSSGGSGDEWDPLWAALSIIFGMWGFIMGGFAYVTAATEPTGFGAAAYGLIACFLSLIFGFAALPLVGTSVGLLLGFVGLIFSVEGIVLGGIAAIKGGLVTSAGIMGIIAVVLGIIGVVFSIESLPGV